MVLWYLSKLNGFWQFFLKAFSDDHWFCFPYWKIERFYPKYSAETMWVYSNLDLENCTGREKRMINPFQANAPFLYPLKTSGFLTFSGLIEREHWPEMG